MFVEGAVRVAGQKRHSKKRINLKVGHVRFQQVDAGFQPFGDMLPQEVQHRGGVVESINDAPILCEGDQHPARAAAQRRMAESRSARGDGLFARA